MKTIVEITWDTPKEQEWLCASNIETALSVYCKNTKFIVREISEDVVTKGLIEKTKKALAEYLNPLIGQKLEKSESVLQQKERLKQHLKDQGVEEPKTFTKREFEF